MTRMIDRLDASRRPMVDSFGQRITYVRLSVTDRCDLRCRYCMAERMTFMPRRDLLSYEEMLALAHVLIERGVRRIRLTGGEPLVRRDVMWLIDRLGARIGSGLDELTLPPTARSWRIMPAPCSMPGCEGSTSASTALIQSGLLILPGAAIWARCWAGSKPLPRQGWRSRST